MKNSYKSAIDLLTSHGKFYINLGLERVEKVLGLLNNPQDKLKIIHVAGTNGKGSVCSIISTILAENSLQVGLYTSPHIFEYTERIKINGADISQDDFAKYVYEVVKIADNHNINLTEFEILTVVMFKYFYDRNVDIAVVETGLGGRFDATNVIKENICSVITHIDFDHTERLGNTLEKIATEKSGIIKKNCPVVTSENFAIIKKVAENLNTKIISPKNYECSDLLRLKGTYQKENLNLALTVVTTFFPQIADNEIKNGLKKVNHPYRFQEIKKNLIVDGAHNPNGAKALRQSIDFYYPNKPVRFVFGCLKNKNYKEMIKILFKDNDEIYFNHFSHTNSATFEELRQACTLKANKFQTLNDFRDDKLTVVCGSLYMISEVIPH